MGRRVRTKRDGHLPKRAYFLWSPASTGPAWTLRRTAAAVGRVLSRPANDNSFLLSVNLSVYTLFASFSSLNFVRVIACCCTCYLSPKCLTPVKIIVVNTEDGCPISLTNGGYFGQPCTSFRFILLRLVNRVQFRGTNEVVIVGVREWFDGGLVIAFSGSPNFDSVGRKRGDQRETESLLPSITSARNIWILLDNETPHSPEARSGRAPWSGLSCTTGRGWLPHHTASVGRRCGCEIRRGWRYWPAPLRTRSPGCVSLALWTAVCAHRAITVAGRLPPGPGACWSWPLQSGSSEVPGHLKPRP